MISKKTILLAIFLIFFRNLRSSPVVINDDFGEIYPKGMFIVYMTMFFTQNYDQHFLCKMLNTFTKCVLHTFGESMSSRPKIVFFKSVLFFSLSTI